MTDQWRPGAPGRPSAPPPAGQPSQPGWGEAPPEWGQTHLADAGEPADGTHLAAPAAGDRTHLAPSSPHAPSQPAQPWTPPLPQSQSTPPRAPQPAINASGTAAYGDRFVAPVEEPGTARKQRGLTPEQKRRLRTPLIVGLVLALVAAVAGWYFVFGRPQNGAGTTVTATASGSKPVVRKPDEVVRNYLNAVAAGRFAEAASYGPLGQGSQMLLTDDVGRKSVERLPITDIKVSPADDTATAVKASYVAGGEKVDTQIKVQRQTDGSWQLAQPTITMRIDGKRSEGVPVIINGVKVDAIQVEIIPGYYEVTTGLPFIGYQQGTDVRATSLASAAEIKNLTTEITPEGLEAMSAAGRASLQQCLTSGQLAPAGCPFGNKVAGTPTNVTWTLVGDPWATFAPLLQAGTSTAATTMTIQTDLAFALEGGATSSQTLTNVARLTCELGVKDVSDVKVVWHRQ